MEEYLAHHGIKGQHWGVRRFESSSGHLTAAGKARYYGDSDSYIASNGVKVGAPKSKGGEKFETKQKGLTDKQRKIIGVGMVAVGTGLAAYGGYKLYQLNKQTNEALSNDYHKKAVNEFVNARKLDARYYGDMSAKTFNAAADARDRAKTLQKAAQSKNYSLREKVDYLKSTKSSSSAQNPIDKYANKSAQTMKIRGEKTFIDAAKANDDLVQELLKKNAKNLGL